MPIPPHSSACAAAAGNFLFLGKLLARCMMDGRLFDLPLSPLIFKVCHALVITPGRLSLLSRFCAASPSSLTTSASSTTSFTHVSASFPQLPPRMPRL